MRISNQKNITISKNFGAVDNVFNYNMILQFKPDQMNVKLINFYTAGADEIYILHCTTINESLGSFFPLNFSRSELAINAKNFPVNTEWEFKILKISDGLVNNTASKISFTLEFIQFADK